MMSQKEIEEWLITLRQWQLSGEKKGSRTRKTMIYVLEQILEGKKFG
jgi:hypothetical protein